MLGVLSEGFSPDAKNSKGCLDARDEWLAFLNFWQCKLPFHIRFRIRWWRLMKLTYGKIWDYAGFGWSAFLEKPPLQSPCRFLRPDASKWEVTTQRLRFRRQVRGAKPEAVEPLANIWGLKIKKKYSSDETSNPGDPRVSMVPDVAAQLMKARCGFGRGRATP